MILTFNNIKSGENILLYKIFHSQENVRGESNITYSTLNIIAAKIICYLYVHTYNLENYDQCVTVYVLSKLIPNLIASFALLIGKFYDNAIVNERNYYDSC